MKKLENAGNGGIINIFLHFCSIYAQYQSKTRVESCVKMYKKMGGWEKNIEKMPETHCVLKMFMIKFYLYG